MEKTKKDEAIEKVQNLYADTLEKLSNGGFVLLITTFAIFVSGFLKNQVDLEEYASLLKLRAGEFLEMTGTPKGWHWVEKLNYGDMLSFAGVVFLAAVSFFVYLRILPELVKERDRIYVWIVTAQIAVFGLAASGVISGGH